MSGFKMKLDERVTFLSFDVGVRHLASWYGFWDPATQALQTIDWRCDDVMPDVPPQKTIGIQLCVDRVLKFFLAGPGATDGETVRDEWEGPPWGLERAEMVVDACDSDSQEGDEDGDGEDGAVRGGGGGGGCKEPERSYMQLLQNGAVDHVLIESQPNFNTKMKCVSHVLQTLCSLHFPNATVHFVSAKLKNSFFKENEAIQDDYQRYSANKKGSIAFIRDVMGIRIPAADKQDDLADAFLQVVAVVERQRKTDEVKCQRQMAAAARRAEKKQATVERKAREKEAKQAAKQAAAAALPKADTSAKSKPKSKPKPKPKPRSKPKSKPKHTKRHNDGADGADGADDADGADGADDADGADGADDADDADTSAKLSENSAKSGTDPDHPCTQVHKRKRAH
jgi:hypothetical protein